MAIPSQTEMIKYVLETMVGYTEFSRSQAKEVVCSSLGLTEEEQKQKTSSGALVYKSRTGWAVSWLCAAGFVTRVRRGTYIVSEAGKNILARRLELHEFIRELRIARDAGLQGSEEQEILFLKNW